MSASHIKPEERLIVALDVDSKAEALGIVDSLAGIVSFYKVGYQLFIGQGPGVVKDIIARGARVFLDLKINDVAETVRLAVREVAKMKGVDFLTIQGTSATARSAVEGRGAASYPRLLFVTMLSSLDGEDLEELGGPTGLDDYIERRARNALDNGCDGVIASGASVRLIRERFKAQKPIIVTPGVRPAGAASNEHKRALTPYSAIRSGSDYLVVGRPIRDADDRPGMARAIISQIERATLGTGA